MNIFKKIAAAVLGLALTASSFAVTAASETAPGYKFVNTYNESKGTITVDVYVMGGWAGVGQIGFNYDPELITLATKDGKTDYNHETVKISNIVTAFDGRNPGDDKDYDVTATPETNKVDNLIDEEKGEFFFAWYSDAEHNVDAREDEVKILSFGFKVNEGVTAEDMEEAGTDLITYAKNKPANRAVSGIDTGVYVSNENNTAFRNGNKAKNPITIEVEYVGLDIEEDSETITITVVDSDGKPVEGAYVKVGTTVKQTDKNGQADFKVSGSYSVSYKYTKNDEYVTLGSGKTEAVLSVPAKMSKPAITTGTEKLTIKWTAPSSTGGSDVTKYIVSLTKGTTEKTYEYDADTTKATIENLTGGSKYTIKVAAVNAIGQGEYSPEATATPSKASGGSTGGTTGGSTGGSSGGGAPAVVNYVVTYDAGTNGKIVSGSKTESVKSGAKPVAVPTIEANEGYKFLGWAKAGGSVIDPKNVVINGATTFVAQYEKLEDKEETGAGSTAAKNPFVDVKENDWFYASVQTAYGNGLMNGVSATEFNPAGDVTRAMFVTVLYRMENSPENAGNEKFTDVEKGSWYDKAVAWASANGIVNGVSDTEFAPNNKITREQMAAMVYRYATFKKADMTVTKDLSAYEDFSSVSAYAVPAMKWVCGKGIINGMTATTLVPQGTSTRAQAATVFVRTADALK